MRCKCCNQEGALAYDPPDYYCETCLHVIYKTVGKEFTLGDLMDLVLGEEDIQEEFKR